MMELEFLFLFYQQNESIKSIQAFKTIRNN